MANQHGAPNLNTGITGFFDGSSNISPQVDFKHFKSACFGAARRVAGAVSHIEDTSGRNTPNFHFATIDFENDNGSADVLCNHFWPIIAFAQTSPHLENSHLRFRNCPSLDNAFVVDGRFQLLSKEALNLPVHQLNLEFLSPAERGQIAYWKPQTLGEIVFNHWA